MAENLAQKNETSQTQRVTGTLARTALPQVLLKNQPTWGRGRWEMALMGYPHYRGLDRSNQSNQ